LRCLEGRRKEVTHAKFVTNYFYLKLILQMVKLSNPSPLRNRITISINPDVNSNMKFRNSFMVLMGTSLDERSGIKKFREKFTIVGFYIPD